jgi:uncharacterized protein
MMSTVKTIRVKVKPRSHISNLDGPDADGLWLARLKSPPMDGKANAELIALVARHFACPRSAISIKSGTTGRLKQVQIRDN